MGVAHGVVSKRSMHVVEDCTQLWDVVLPRSRDLMRRLYWIAIGAIVIIGLVGALIYVAMSTRTRVYTSNGFMDLPTVVPALVTPQESRPPVQTAVILPTRSIVTAPTIQVTSAEQ